MARKSGRKTKQDHQRVRNPSTRAHNRHKATQFLKESPAIGNSNSSIVYRRRTSSSEANAMLKKTFQSSDSIFHSGWFIFGTDASRTFYIVDQHTREIRQAVRIRLFSDMSAEELSNYQSIASHCFRDSISHNKVTSNAAAQLGSGTMYAMGWRAGYENFTDHNTASKVPAAYGTYAPGKKTARDDWMHLRSADQSIHTLYGKSFFELLPMQFSMQQAIARETKLPFLGQSNQSSADGSDDFLFGPNMTYTCDGFYNAVHTDNDANDHMAFGIFLPVTANKFVLASNSDGYSLLSGGFINVHYKTNLNFAEIDGIVEMAWWGSSDAHCTLKPEFVSAGHTHLGTSIQVSKMLKMRVEKLSTSVQQNLIIDDAQRDLLQQEGRMK